MKIPFPKFHIEYSEIEPVTKTVLSSEKGWITLLACKKNQEIKAHTSPYDVIVTGIEGAATIISEEKKIILAKGDIMLIPAKTSHSLFAKEDFKLSVTLIK